MSEQKKNEYMLSSIRPRERTSRLNIINDVFSQHNIKWTVSVTQKYGDATEFARTAAEDGFDQFID